MGTRNMVILAAVAILAIASCSTAYKYSTTTEEGLYGVQPNHQTKRRIASGQCTGEVKFPNDYKCEAAGRVVAPDVVSVEVRDEGGPPKLLAEDGLNHVDIYRHGGCHGDALIIVSFHC